MDIESAEKWLDTLMNQFNKNTNQKEGNQMLKEDVKQVVKFVNAKVDPTVMWNTAKDAAVFAVDEFMKDKEEPMYCGFANITIRPAQGKFVGWLKKQGIGDNGYRGGWRVSYYDIMPQTHKYRHTHNQ